MAARFAPATAVQNRLHDDFVEPSTGSHRSWSAVSLRLNGAPRGIAPGLSVPGARSRQLPLSKIVSMTMFVDPPPKVLQMQQSLI
jgi:hypothetical protein